MEPNWFVAWPVAVDPGFAMPEAPRAVRVFHRGDHHITAAFLGPCGEEAAHRVFDATTAIEGPVTGGTFGNVVALGNPARPSTLSARIDHGNASFAEVIAAHRDAWLALAGRPPDRYGVLPHCTLARATRRATEDQRQTAVAWGQQIPTAGVAFEVRPLALYTWNEDRSERLFRIVRPS